MHLRCTFGRYTSVAKMNFLGQEFQKLLYDTQNGATAWVPSSNKMSRTSCKCIEYPVLKRYRSEIQLSLINPNN